MANQKQHKDILEIISELPKDLRDAYFSHSTTEAINETGKKHGLAIDKIGELAHETGLVMIGITPPAEYIKNLTRRLDVAQEKAKTIAGEINQKVFQPVRESLKKVHGLTPTGAEVSAPPASGAPGAPISTIPKPQPIATPPPTPSLPRRGAEEVKSPPLQGGAGEVIKPPPLEKRLPTKEEIKVAPPPPPKLPVEKVKPTPTTPPPPSIFAKLPAKIQPAPDVEAKPSIPPIFEKHIPNENKSRDPYREPLE